MPRRSNSSTSVVVCDTFTTDVEEAMCHECPTCIAYTKMLANTGDGACSGTDAKGVKRGKGSGEKGRKKVKS